jgi:hypothetical protein
MAFRLFWQIFLILYACVFMDKHIVAQDNILLSNLVHEKWKYSYQIHLGDNQTIHTALQIDWQLYFSVTDTLYMQWNDQSSFAHYILEDNQIQSSILPFSSLKVISCQSDELILEFRLNTSDQYHFYFHKSTLDNTPSFTPSSMLNTIVYRYKNPRQEELIHQEYLQSIGKKKSIRTKTQKTNYQSFPDDSSPEFLQIEMTGGGFRGGIDPVYRNILLIRNDGSLLFEYETKSSGLQTWKKKLNRDSLNSLITYIESKNFFTFEKIYSCRSASCYKRLSGDPVPIALRLCITKGTMRKVVSIAIWDGKGREKALIDYPAALDDIVRAIQLVADISIK